MVAGGQRETRTELLETVVGSSVSSKFHAHDEMHPMTVTRPRIGWWRVGVCGRVSYDYSKDSRNTEPLAPRLRTNKKPIDFPIVARSQSRSVASAQVQHQFTFHVTVWTMMKPPCAVKRAKSQPLTTHQNFKRGAMPRLADCILRLSWCGSYAKGEVASRSTPWLDLLVLSPALGFVGGSRLFWMTLRGVEPLRDHNDVSDLILTTAKLRIHTRLVTPLPSFNTHTTVCSTSCSKHLSCPSTANERCRAWSTGARPCWASLAPLSRNDKGNLTLCCQQSAFSLLASCP